MNPMTWTYRVMRDADNEYSIREVYSNEDGILGWTQRGQHPWGETPEVLREILGWMLAACDKPVLDEPELERLAALEEIRAADNRLLEGGADFV